MFPELTEKNVHAPQLTFILASFQASAFLIIILHLLRILIYYQQIISTSSVHVFSEFLSLRDIGFFFKILVVGLVLFGVFIANDRLARVPKQCIGYDLVPEDTPELVVVFDVDLRELYAYYDIPSRPSLPAHHPKRCFGCTRRSSLKYADSRI